MWNWIVCDISEKEMYNNGGENGTSEAPIMYIRARLWKSVKYESVLFSIMNTEYNLDPIEIIIRSLYSLLK